MPFKFRDLFSFHKMSAKATKDLGGDEKQITCLLIGAGNRGFGYAYYAVAFPKEFKIVGVADLREFYRKRVQNEHNIPDKFVFENWTEAAAKEKFADCVIIATTDRHHKAPAVAFANKGYHILLEKPMAVTEEECREIASACKKNNIMLAVCHVLRYIAWAHKIKEIIDSGEIGDVVNIQHTEPVGFWHFAHSYVRGNWRNEALSSNSLLAKCCHDIDLIKYWLGSAGKCVRVSSFGSLLHFRKEDKVGFWHFAHSFVRGNWRNEALSSNSLLAKCCHDIDLIKYWLGNAGKCVRVSSFGSLLHFRKEDKPKGAGERCLDCSVEPQCPYSAKRLYLDMVRQGHTGWPVDVVAEVPDIESVTQALKTGPYGRCVYQCDNDVMSNQVTNFQFENGATASLTMVAFTKRVCGREVMVYGTKGEIRCQAPEVEVFDFLTENTRRVDCHTAGAPGRLGGHGGSDYHLMKAFVSAIRTGSQEHIQTGVDDTLASHLLVFAAEKARKENCVVQIQPDGTF